MALSGTSVTISSLRSGSGGMAAILQEAAGRSGANGHLDDRVTHAGDVHRDAEELLDDFDVGARVSRQRKRAERATAGERQRQQELIGQVLTDRHVGGEVLAR